MTAPSPLNYNQRLATFSPHWDAHPATTRQLAALGHVCDRPPLEALEQGSHCISCDKFVAKQDSIHGLEGPMYDETQAEHQRQDDFEMQFHHPQCIRAQVRLPLDSQALRPDWRGGFSMNELRSRWENRASQLGGRHEVRVPAATADVREREREQTSHFFSLPTELRLEIYAQVLPRLPAITKIVPLNKDSSRLITATGHAKPTARDPSAAGILRTCRAIHTEALDILFRDTTYKFASPRTLYLFLRQIGAHARRHNLRAVDVYCGFREDAVAFALLMTCERLATLTIRLARPVLMYPRAPIWLVDGVTCLLNLSGLEQVRFEDCEGPGGTKGMKCLREGSRDAEVVRRELTRPRGTEMGVRTVDGQLDL